MAMRAPWDPPGAQRHDSATQLIKRLIDLEIMKLLMLGNDLRQQFLELRNVPLVVTELQDRPVQSLFRRDPEGAIEGRIRCDDLEALVKDENRFSQCLDNVLLPGPGSFVPIMADSLQAMF